MHESLWIGPSLVFQCARSCLGCGIKNYKGSSPVNKFDTVNKAYVDSIKYKTTTGIIPNIAMTDIYPTFSAAKAFASGKIIICETSVERLADEWITTSSPMFAIAWPGFHKFSSVGVNEPITTVL